MTDDEYIAYAYSDAAKHGHPQEGGEEPEEYMQPGGGGL
jgi:hypothetical protein